MTFHGVGMDMDMDMFSGQIFTVIVGPRQLRGLLSGAPYPYRKAKETHKLIFSWLLSLTVLLVGRYT